LKETDLPPGFRSGQDLASPGFISALQPLQERLNLPGGEGLEQKVVNGVASISTLCASSAPVINTIRLAGRSAGCARRSNR
jgi:hypothetical protein